MSELKPAYKEHEKKLKELEREVRKGKTAENRLKKLEQQFAEVLDERNKKAQMIATIRAMIAMPEIYLDHNWNIVGYSDDFPFLTGKVMELADKRKNLREFLVRSDFDRIQQYQEMIGLLEDLPYDEGRKWQLRYTGPNEGDKIGESWIEYEVNEKNEWQIKELRL